MSVSIHEVAKKYSDSLKFSTSAYPLYSVEYVWIKDISLAKLSSKTRKFPRYFEGIPQVRDIPRWVFNIRTNQDSCDTGYLHPVRLYRDPFRLEKNLLTLCETFSSNDEPTEQTKKRLECKSAIESGSLVSHDCIFEIEQEFVFFEHPEITTIAQKNCIRKAVESFYRACTYMGLSISSFSIENHPDGFLTYKIGPRNGLQISDELWMSRYVLRRVAEEFHLMPSFGFLPKSIMPRGYRDYNPNAHFSFSTREMRVEDGLRFVESCVKNLQCKCAPNLNANNYVTVNTEDDALTNTTVKFSKVQTVGANGKSYHNIDLRCRGDCDPYAVTKAIVMTVFS